MKSYDGNVNLIQRLMSFSERLRAARRLVGLDQTEFGAIGGVSRGAQSNYEKAIRAPDVDYLLRIAEAGVDIGELLTGAPTATPLFTNEELEGLALIRAAPPEIAAAVTTILRGAQRTGERSTGASLHAGPNPFAGESDKP